MSFRQTISNPFYVLLLIAGLAFSITACAYGVMTVRGLRQDLRGSDSGESFMVWIDEHGFALMLIELALLALFCVLAITTDGYWEKRRRTGASRTEPRSG